MNIAIVVLILCLFVVFFQDWKSRKIHIVLPVAIFGLSFYVCHFNQSLKNIAYNSIFFIITLIILIAYMTLKNKQFLNPFENYFGLGDLLFYLAISPIFLLKNYVIFFISSMVFAILMQFFLQSKIQEKEVPLAGFSALLVVFVLLLDTIFDFQKITLL